MYILHVHTTCRFKFTTYIVMTEWEPRLTVILHERNNPSFKSLQATQDDIARRSGTQEGRKSKVHARGVPTTCERSSQTTECIGGRYSCTRKGRRVERAPQPSSKFDDTGSKTKLKRATERQIIQSADPDILQESHIAATEWITRKKKVHS